MASAALAALLVLTAAEQNLEHKYRFQKCPCFNEDDEALLLWAVETLVIRDLWRSLVHPCLEQDCARP